MARNAKQLVDHVNNHCTKHDCNKQLCDESQRLLATQSETPNERAVAVDVDV